MAYRILNQGSPARAGAAQVWIQEIALETPITPQASIVEDISQMVASENISLVGNVGLPQAIRTGSGTFPTFEAAIGANSFENAPLTVDLLYGFSRPWHSGEGITARTEALPVYAMPELASTHPGQGGETSEVLPGDLSLRWTYQMAPVRIRYEMSSSRDVCGMSAYDRPITGFPSEVFDLTLRGG